MKRPGKLFVTMKEIRKLTDQYQTWKQQTRRVEIGAITKMNNYSNQHYSNLGGDSEIPLEYQGRKYQNLPAPGPRKYMLEEFKEFSRKQIEFFIDIHYSFKNAKKRFMGFEDF
ncbi:hypothetical protein B9Z55_023925 [Caenorhabditis nigoni]|uniref:Uncharacterized protein n=2 Tax=Caenorhabditis nigoni TaxID=1611254 RepID=A0A2G5SSD2_9PELO|nr:hypothetical protein B9Z55_023925 [Caenorhabditis nigoni]